MGIKDNIEDHIEGVKEGQAGPESVSIDEAKAAEGLNPVEMDREADRDLNLSMETD